MTYCCKMREKFLITIVGERKDIPTPIELVDFVLDWDHESGKPLIGIKFCPFCGIAIDHTQTLRN